MTIFQATVLGVVQGLTEFLPVSSSGHLVLANYWFGFGGADESLELAATLATNTGTFLAVLLVLRRDVWNALLAFLQGLRPGAAGAEARGRDGWRMALLVIVGTVPTALIVFGLSEGLFERLNAPVPVSVALIATGLMLWVAPRGGEDAPKRRARELSWLDGVITGIAQGLAGIPGISRSGATITTLMARGASGDLAYRLSFLLYLAASFGVAILGATEVRDAGFGLAPLLAMTAASFVTGWAALLWLRRLLRRGRFHLFAPYLWVVAALTLGRALLF